MLETTCHFDCFDVIFGSSPHTELYLSHCSILPSSNRGHFTSYSLWTLTLTLSHLATCFVHLFDLTGFFRVNEALSSWGRCRWLGPIVFRFSCAGCMLCRGRCGPFKCPNTVRYNSCMLLLGDNLPTPSNTSTPFYGLALDGAR